MPEAQTKYIHFTCPSSQCGKNFKMVYPAKGGVYKITCPHCEHVMHVQIPALQEAEQQGVPNVTPPSGSQQDDSTPAPPQVQNQRPASLDNSDKEPIAIDRIFTVNEKYSVTCPHCNTSNIPYKPSKTGVIKGSCPVCKGKLVFTVQVPTVIETKIAENQQGFTQMFDAPGTPHAPKIFGKLVQQSFLQRKLPFLKSSKAEWLITQKETIIGRRDMYTPSDIQIPNDVCISRRCLKLTVKSTYNGNLYIVELLKTANPVYINDKPLMPGDVQYLKFGDRIRMGKTVLQFKQYQ